MTDVRECLPQDWRTLSGDDDPRGYTGLEGVGVVDVEVPAGKSRQLIRWAGAPTRPTRLQVLVGPSPKASAAEQAAFLDRSVRLSARWAAGPALYRADIDAGGAFGLVCSSLDLELVNDGAAATRVCASVVPAVSGAPSARRTVLENPGAGAKVTSTVPRFARAVTVLSAFNGGGSMIVTATDPLGAALASIFITPGTAGPWPTIPLPVGSAFVEVTNPSAGAVPVALIFDLGT